MLKRISVIFCAALLQLVSPRAAEPVVGAIRWDAWQEGGSIQKAVEKTLGPAHWHHRLPFFAKVTGSNSVSIPGGTQEIMDQEITCAADAGIAYWAFCIYDEASAMSRGLQLYLASPLKHRINFALNLQGGHIAGHSEKWDAEVARFVNYFKDPSYQKIAGNRPLVFLFNPVKPTPRFPDAAAVKAAFNQLRSAATNAGAGNPYIVFQGWNAARDFKTMQDYGLDALGAYAVWSGSTNGTPYAKLAARAHAFWEEGKATGAEVVPTVSTGWDNRPRHENPTSWDSGSTTYTLPPTPTELTAHVADALDWTRSNRFTAARANTVLIYGWNENDEGGWLVPTLGADGAPNEERIAALKKVLRPNEPGQQNAQELRP